PLPSLPSWAVLARTQPKSSKVRDSTSRLFVSREILRMVVLVVGNRGRRSSGFGLRLLGGLELVGRHIFDRGIAEQDGPPLGRHVLLITENMFLGGHIIEQTGIPDEDVAPILESRVSSLAIGFDVQLQFVGVLRPPHLLVEEGMIPLADDAQVI